MSFTYTIDSPPSKIAAARADFPMLSQKVHGKPLTYLDSAATSLKPQVVIDRISHFYANEYGTVRRGNYFLSQQATTLYEGVREKVAHFINADPDEIVFVRGVTEAINQIAISFSRGIFSPDDEVLVTELEHHANIVPWLLIAKQTGIKLKFVPISTNNEITLKNVRASVTSKTRLIATTHVSNATGTINPIKEIGQIAREVGAAFLVDGAQSAPHLPIDVRELDCDFFVFSGHKMLAPTGIGALFGKRKWLAKMDPAFGGGDMIDYVSFEKITFQDPPHRFEAGTPPFAQVIGFGAAIDYLNSIGMETIHQWDQILLNYAKKELQTIEDLHIISAKTKQSGLLSFSVKNVHPFDLGVLLDQFGVAIRTGQHCAQPILRRLDLFATARASFYLYNNKADIDRLIFAIKEALSLLR